MAKKKQRWIKNNIVYDPNIGFPSVFDFEYEDVCLLRKQYRGGKTKRKKYRGV